MNRTASVAGGLLGLAVADAETAGRLRGFEPHQVTHYTQLTRELLDSLTQHRGLKALDVAARFAHLGAAGRLVGAPTELLSAAARLEARVPLAEAGTRSPHSSGDAVVRACAVGWFYASAPERLVEPVLLQAQATQLDARCGVASVLVALVIAGLTQGEGRDVEALFSHVTERVATLDPMLAQQLSDLLGYAGLPGAEAEAKLTAEVDPEDGARVATLWALWSWLAHRQAFQRALHSAQRCPEPSGAAARLTGALFGTEHGAQALPALANRVHDRGRWDAAALTALAGRTL